VFARHLGDTYVDLEEVKKSAREGPPSKPSKPIDPAVERELILKLQAEHYAKWPDERLPALGGRTPRQAVRSKRGRAQLQLDVALSVLRPRLEPGVPRDLSDHLGLEFQVYQFVLSRLENLHRRPPL